MEKSTNSSFKFINWLDTRAEYLLLNSCIVIIIYVCLLCYVRVTMRWVVAVIKSRRTSKKFNKFIEIESGVGVQIYQPKVMNILTIFNNHSNGQALISIGKGRRRITFVELEGPHLIGIITLNLGKSHRFVSCCGSSIRYLFCIQF